MALPLAGLFYFCISLLLQNSKTPNMKKGSGFEKFFKGGPKKGAAKREEFRKEKRVARKEREEKIKQSKAGKRSRFDVQKADGEKRAEAPKYNLEPPQKRSGAKLVKKNTTGSPSASKNIAGKPAPAGKATPARKFTPNIKPQTPNTSRPGRDQTTSPKPQTPSDQMPLNKYIAHGGVCSRRDAVELIKGGKVKVNGELILEPGHKVSLTDTVAVAGKKIKPVEDLVYILLNKPKDYITTTDDPQQRKTVLDLLKGAPDTRLYPVGRLDRNTSGVLLLTNDGDLSQKLTHPSNEVKKVYAVTLDKPLTRAHFDAILKGVPLEDGMAHVDVLAFPDPKNTTEVGVELHSGRNRIVRRIFEHFGYDIKALDRVVFAGLTKKNVNRGKWRFLTEKEVRDLKFFKRGR
jgi:23S rRNA pseudouridine2605 synthase